MASNLDVNIFDYVAPFNNNNIQVQPKKQVTPKTSVRTKTRDSVIIKGTKKPLTKLNIFMMAMVFSLLAIESVIYFHSVQAGVGANKLQTEINKVRESNDFLRVDLANLKELSKIEKLAVSGLGMTTANSEKINYLPLPKHDQAINLNITNIAPKEKEVLVPVGY